MSAYYDTWTTLSVIGVTGPRATGGGGGDLGGVVMELNRNKENEEKK